MTPARLSEKVLAERSEWVRDTLIRICALPLEDFEEFTAERRKVDAAESCLRRAREARLDLGRHILARTFGDAPAEYRTVAARLGDRGELNAEERALFGRMASYRNRLVHFCDEISDAELYEICTRRLSDVETVLGGLHRWIRMHPENLSEAL
jgi:uncharacterized protein YutE (UPF0331/DUF86 family)